MKNIAVSLFRLVEKKDLLKQIHPGKLIFLLANAFFIRFTSVIWILEPLYNILSINGFIALLINA